MPRDIEKPNTETVSKNPSPNQFIHFEWDTVLRVVGIVTGIAGIATALLYVFGYAYITRLLLSLGIRDEYYSVAIPNERYLLYGLQSLLDFVVKIALLLIAYFVVQAIIQTIGPDLLRHIKRQRTALVAGFVLWGIFLYIGILFMSVSDGIPYALFFAFIGFDILLMSFRTAYIENSIERKPAQYYNLFKSTIVIVKMIGLSLVIFFMFYDQLSSNISLLRGCQYVTERPLPFTIHSSQPLGLEGEDSNANSYIIDGYFLLYADNSSYYLFNELDSESLKPKSVIIVKKDIVDVVRFENNPPSPNWNLTKTCLELYGN